MAGEFRGKSGNSGASGFGKCWKWHTKAHQLQARQLWNTRLFFLTFINGPAAADPTSGIVYVTSVKNCTTRQIVPGEEADLQWPNTTGTTVAEYAVGRGFGAPRHPAGIPLFKPPYSKITAIDLNTGEHLWYLPVGETPNRYKNNPALAGIDIGNTGTGAHAVMAVTDTLLMYASEMSDGTAALFAVDKATGEQVGKIAMPKTARYGMMTYVHEGHQFILLQTGSTLTTMALPGWDAGQGGAAH